MLIPKFRFPRCARNDKNGEKKWGAWVVAFSPIYRPPISFLGICHSERSEETGVGKS